MGEERALIIPTCCAWSPTGRTRGASRRGEEQPSMPELSTAYYAQYIEAARSHWWFRGRERVVQSVARPLVQHLRMLVVDVGSGPGGPARAVFPDARIVAMDVSLMPLRANTSADERVVGDAARVPCRTGSLAALCAFDVLEHLEDDMGALREWHRVLRPGGWLVLTVPAYQALWSAHDDLNGHRRRYRRRALQRLLSDTGFLVRRLTYFSTILLPAVALVRWTQRLLKSRRPQEVSSSGLGELDFQQRFPRWLERCFEGAFQLEAMWLRRHTLPAGVSICAVVQARPCAE